MEQRASNY